MAELNGKKVLIISTNYGTERDELQVPLEGLQKLGAEVTVAAPNPEEIRTRIMDDAEGPHVLPDATFADVHTSQYDVLVVPGGTLNADTLRGDENARRIATEFAAAGKPIAAICHAPWLLVDTGLARGKRLTSYKSLSTDVKNAGGDWVDAPLVRDDSDGWTLITSRFPDDLSEFVPAIARELVGQGSAQPVSG
ncbi:type 1 glutamine amidotransferase domain-containing protein [Gryllotalpicola ginsengisoli]|uniref:type 1 glutamine amidotransferase domain-containing protein n=1 Tax=Gryllotalpicola ginsengisoli TaxID=444608 RepID=UPI0003B71AE9|nr:type 1 glutamine amidotransferase domain-containing protein [Gryllotalpicola ginsengisoli]